VAAPDQFSNPIPSIPRRWNDSPGRDREPAETILILAGQEINRRVLKGVLRTEGYRILECSHPREASILLQRKQVDLIVLGDLTPEGSGHEFCRALKAGRETRFIPIILVSSIQGEESEIEGIASGADAFLVEPPPPALIRARVRAMLRHKQAIDSLDQADAVLVALAQAVEHRDSRTAGHCERLAIMSTSLGAAMGLSRADLITLYRAGYLHDIGKVAVPDAILFKPGPLDEDEWDIMKQHVLKGVEICSPARTLAAVLPVVRGHHEKWDGSGYPDGLRGEQIPLLARILQVADVFDALISPRPYKPALSVEDALRVMEEEVQKGWRDPALVQLLRQFCTTPINGGNGFHAFPYVLPQAFEWSIENLRRALAQAESQGNGNGHVRAVSEESTDKGERRGAA
jgi:putative two-component system response regulator